MRWTRGRRSSHLDDRRASSGGGFGGFGGFGGLGGGFGRGGGFGYRRRPGGFALGGGRRSSVGCLPIGCGGGLLLPLVLVVGVFLLFGRGCLFAGGGGGFGGFGDVFGDLPQFSPAPPGAGAGGIPSGAPDPEAEQVDFVSFVLDDLQATWADRFQDAGQTYTPADLVLFRRATNTSCGAGTSDTGPFYCPADQTVYLDLDFFAELVDRFGAPGDFAQAYVIAHEIGHHVQNLTGVSDEVHSRQQQDPEDANELSVRLELQADCLAGVWAHSTYERGILESGDLEEGLTAAASIGDDRIQSQAGAEVNPETWTHGSSEQRSTWLRTGFDSGDPADCDTFDVSEGDL
ncbi:MAG TPA: neutral zinc metallopeptidase [Acidimicrobiales bacterium]